MSFFKDLNDDATTKSEGLDVDDNQMVDTLGETTDSIDELDKLNNLDKLDGLDNLDSLDEFDLSEDDSLGIDEDMLKKMDLEENIDNEVQVTDMKEPEVTDADDTAKTETADSNESFYGVTDLNEEGRSENNLVKGQLGADTVTIQKSNAHLENNEVTSINTVISKGTVINGSIVSDGSLDVFGTVNGDISCLGKLSISGSVKGKSSAAEVYLNTNRLDGGITSKGSVKIGVGTVVIGDVTATSCVIAGAVKGDLDVNGPVIVDSTAVVKGNINAKGIQVNNGAVVDGFCALPYASVDIESYFGEEG